MAGEIRLDGQVALVTGATGGWGRGAAIAAAERGAAVVVNARSQANVDAVVAKIGHDGGKAIGFVGDVGTFEGGAASVAATVGAYGRLDVLVNSTGATRSPTSESRASGLSDEGASVFGGPLLVMEPADWHRIVATELTAVVSCTQAAVRQMMAQGDGGRVITVAGAAGIYGLPGGSAHAAAKGAVASATWGWSQELLDTGITVNMIRGRVSSFLTNPFYDGLEGDVSPEAVAAREADRFFSGDDAAPLVVWLASAEANDVTGAYVGIDGAKLTIWEPKFPEFLLCHSARWTAETIGDALLPILGHRAAVEDDRQRFLQV